MSLTGEANDYVGKGMHGGELVVVPPKNAGFTAAYSSIVGNACLYGATGGDFHCQGRAGERFGVRNSGAFAVAEGAGDHCCEYMTGGVVAILGSVGRNVGAGMTGGIGYFYDIDGTFAKKVNNEIVKMQRIVTTEGEAQLKTMVERHYQLTGSKRADEILKNWDEAKEDFWQIYPPSEAKTAVVSGDDAVTRILRVSGYAPDGEMCFLPVGSELSPEQTQRCAD
jgi:glutamate synthase (ferredoxin)